jgi:hypothetical protein
MKSKLLFIAVLFLLTGIRANAQRDTLKVYLEKDREYKFGVDLIFENNSNDTIFLLSKFKNLSAMHEMISAPGIFINFLHNGNSFTFNWGDYYDQSFVFSKGRTLIYPKSKVKFVFNLRQYFAFPEKSTDKYEVSFFINYIFQKYYSDECPTLIKYYETNRITMVEPNGETESK